MSDEELIQEETQGPLKTSLIVGGILSAFMLLSYTIVVLVNYENPTIIQYVSFFVILCFSFVAIKVHLDKDLKGEITYGKAFKVSFLTILWFSLIIGAIIYFYFIFNPEKITETTRKQIDYFEKLNDDGKIDDDALAEKKERILSMATPFKQSTAYFIFILFIGIITSLIATAFHKLIRPKKA